MKNKNPNFLEKKIQQNFRLINVFSEIVCQKLYSDASAEHFKMDQLTFDLNLNTVKHLHFTMFYIILLLLRIAFTSNLMLTDWFARKNLRRHGYINNNIYYWYCCKEATLQLQVLIRLVRLITSFTLDDHITFIYFYTYLEF